MGTTHCCFLEEVYQLQCSDRPGVKLWLYHLLLWSSLCLQHRDNDTNVIWCLVALLVELNETLCLLIYQTFITKLTKIQSKDRGLSWILNHNCNNFNFHFVSWLEELVFCHMLYAKVPIWIIGVNIFPMSVTPWAEILVWEPAL